MIFNSLHYQLSAVYEKEDVFFDIIVQCSSVEILSSHKPAFYASFSSHRQIMENNLRANGNIATVIWIIFMQLISNLIFLPIYAVLNPACLTSVWSFSRTDKANDEIRSGAAEIISQFFLAEFETTAFERILISQN